MNSKSESFDRFGYAGARPLINSGPAGAGRVTPDSGFKHTSEQKSAKGKQ
jgi:hypothetical protein